MAEQDNPYYIAYLREKKARVELEQLLEDSTRQLYEKNIVLEQQIIQIQQQQQSVIQQEKLATLGTLAAGVAHEINNPLAFVKSNIDSLIYYCELLLNCADSKVNQPVPQHEIDLIKQDMPELVADTHHGLVRIKDIVKNLLFFARTDSELQTDVSIAAALELAIKLLSPLLKNINLVQHINVVPAIAFNPSELNQVLVNVVLNAIQAFEGVTDRPATIVITLDANESSTRLSIKDNGCGMSEGTLSKMFDAFYTTKAVGAGTGVGMSIVLQILQKHHSTIHVTSALNDGTSVNIDFAHG